ncbi:unnamed protein product [Durusdinium trenchii]|uniref:Uncharacterized protein n=1 Tax=Durusdinium trenchii TaxID=1381693 RepID=A0ABP0RPG3_9DINO
MSAADAGGADLVTIQVAELGEVLPSPEEALKLYFAARRLSQETITLRTHEERCQELGLQGIFYALLDADGSVVLYEVRPPELWSPIDQRRSDEPFLQPEILAQLAQDAGKEQNDKMEKAGEAKKRKRKKDQ